MATIATLLKQNPFYILDLSPGATAIEVERQGRKILGMLELDIKGVAHYSTPWEIRERSITDVRTALAELRDPKRYLFHRFWLITKKQGNGGTSNKSSKKINYIAAVF